MILSGTRPAVIQAVQAVSLHGSIFYDVTFAHDDQPERLIKARLGSEVMYANPQAGDQVTISYLMNMPTQVSKRD
ncbi:MAG TPA: hypothetical protein DEF47_23480 [Herpetosiphon sp.]|uniref:Uncharacterized protein n=1 Tax=Herpetosiphon aurantiacus (strain ATCC 23779 / DSM 785 / 114-95) TaxID=316274 RepID=A9B2M2_HERA2|nr:hypothetical protein [Herpetosiphon sp.]ABX05473.1 conserved hypothetical protein [Herpetosiphon aurantiacus DSM 785]HBW52855.1 hypothetical protein [Herpetosiphon sp.]